jgi:hypothetical protein
MRVNLLFIAGVSFLLIFISNYQCSSNNEQKLPSISHHRLADKEPASPSQNCKTTLCYYRLLLLSNKTHEHPNVHTGRQDHAQTRAIVSLGCDLRHRFPRFDFLSFCLIVVSAVSSAPVAGTGAFASFRPRG